MRCGTSFWLLAAVMVVAATMAGCETAGAAGKGAPAGELMGQVKFEGEDQQVQLFTPAVTSLVDPTKGPAQTRGARNVKTMKKTTEKIKVAVPTTCEGFKYCLDDGSLLECQEGTWVQKACPCGCVYRNGNANCLPEYCKPNSQRTITDSAAGSTIQEVCYEDGCGYRTK